MAAPSPPPQSIPAIADRLLRTMAALEMTQAELCRQAGIEPNTFNQYVKAKSRPELDKALLLCDAFRLTLDWIYRGDPSGLPKRLADKLAVASASPFPQAS